MFRGEALSVQIISKVRRELIGKFKIDQLQSAYVSCMGFVFFICVMKGLACLALLIVNWILDLLTCLHYKFHLVLDSKSCRSISQNIDCEHFFYCCCAILLVHQQLQIQK